jgi:molybdate transport system substrate-binding protein
MSSESLIFRKNRWIGARSAVRVIAILCLAWGSLASAERINVAVANNFADTLRVLAEVFAAGTGHEVVISPGSTGKHYAQIRSGAPYDLFLAADVRRPRLLEQEGLAIPGSRFTYAIGQLVLWSAKTGLIDPGGQVLDQDDFRYLAIANPRLAPYGLAARETLENLGRWDALQSRLVRGENVSQTFQFVHSGNADLGFVALSQVINWTDERNAGSKWLVPPALYTPIEQQVVLIKDSDAGRAFMDFLRQNKAREIILNHGYRFSDHVE